MKQHDPYIQQSPPLSPWRWAHQLCWFKPQGPLRLRLSPNTQSPSQWTVEPFLLQYLEQRKIGENSFSLLQPWRVRKVAREMQGRPRNLPRAGHSVSVQRLCVQKHWPPGFYTLEPNPTLLWPRLLFLYPVVNLQNQFLIFLHVWMFCLQVLCLLPWSPDPTTSTLSTLRWHVCTTTLCWIQTASDVENPPLLPSELVCVLIDEHYEWGPERRCDVTPCHASCLSVVSIRKDSLWLTCAEQCGLSLAYFLGSVSTWGWTSLLYCV